MDDIKENALYEGFDWNRLERKSVCPLWVPERPAEKCESQDIPVADNVLRCGTGDQVGVNVFLPLSLGKDL